VSIFSRLRLAEPPRPDTSEHGSNGVSWNYGRGTPRLRNPEYLYELSGRQGSDTYRRMRFSDPHIAGLRRAQNMPLMRAAASIEPADPDDKDAVEKADFIRRALLEDFPWRAFLSDTCLALDYGFAAFEIVWRIEAGEARFRLALRPASSIDPQDIYVKDGAIEKVVQHPETGGEFEIPGEKLVWFCHDKEGDAFTGRPILRPMYKPWKIKEELEVELPILLRKLGGIPDITTVGEPPKDERDKLDEAGANFGVVSEAFFRHTDDVTVQLLTGSADVGDLLEAIKERNTEITAVCQAQVLDLGTSNSGSRALGTTLGDMFADSIQAQASYKEDVLNAKGGLIHQAIAYNFPSDDNLPKLRFGNVQKADMRAMAAALLQFSQAFGTLDAETEEWARRELNMPEGSASQTVIPEKAPPVPASSKSPGPGADATGGAPEDSGAQASEAHAHGLKLAERREPRGVERYLALDELAKRFDDAKTAVAEATAKTREALVSEIGKRARAAAAKGQLAKFAAGSPPMVDKLTAEIRGALEEFYAAGREQVAGELERQRKGEPVAEEIVAERSGEALAMADPPKKPKRPTPEELIAEQAEMQARSLAVAAQAAAAQQAARIATVPMADDVFDEMVRRELEGAAMRAYGMVSDLMQLGRADEAASQATDVEQAVYSALLDGALCENCEPMDGSTTTDLDEAAGWTPNPDCLGGDRCRCVVVYELKQEAS